MDKTLYLWDLANTLFPEKWNKKLTGFKSFENYVKSLGVDKNNPRDFENCFKEPYEKGAMYNLDISKGFKELLSWTKHNETFSTGMQEQMNWRAKYLNPKVGFDIRNFFQKFNSTFDYGETNKKTKEMMINYLEKKYKEGYKIVVYADDKIENCNFFLNAAKSVRRKHPDFSYRLYHLLNNKNVIKRKDGYWEVGDLLKLLENEKSIKK